MIDQLKKQLNLTETDISNLKNLMLKIKEKNLCASALNQKEKEFLIKLKKNSLNLTSEQIDVIVGNILGDAHLNCRSKNPFLDYGYSKENYAYFVFNKIKNLCRITKPSKYQNKLNPNIKSFNFQTRSLENLNPFKDIFIKTDITTNKNIKIIPSIFVLYFIITERALAF